MRCESKYGVSLRWMLHKQAPEWVLKLVTVQYISPSICICFTSFPSVLISFLYDLVRFYFISWLFLSIYSLYSIPVTYQQVPFTPFRSRYFLQLCSSVCGMLIRSQTIPECTVTCSSHSGPESAGGDLILFPPSDSRSVLSCFSPYNAHSLSTIGLQ